MLCGGLDLRREYPVQPIAGVGAAVLQEGRILLVKRGVDPGRGRWSIPGGVVKLGEGVREAVIREVKEECGIDIEVDRLADVMDNITLNGEGRPRFHFIIIDFLARPRGGTLRPATDAADAQWVPLEEVETYDLTRTFRRFFRKHQGALRSF